MLTLSLHRISSLKHGALFCAIALWAWTCGALLPRVSDSPTLPRIGAYSLLALLPLILLKVARIPIYLLALYAAMVPFSDLLVTHGGATLAKVVGALAGTLLLLSIARNGQAVRLSSTSITLLIFTVYLGATVFWAIDPAIALSTYGIYLSYIFLFLAIALYPVSRGDLALIISATILGSVAAAGYGGYLFLHGQQIVEGRLFIGYNDANSIDANEYASTLLMPIALSLVFCLRSRSIAVKILCFAVLAVLFYAFIISGSRGAMFGLCATAIVLLARSTYRRTMLMLFGIGLVFVMSSPIAMRFLRGDVSSADGRTDIWRIGIASLHQYWLFGAGIGNFPQAYMQYFLRTPHTQLMWMRPAHSIFLQSAVEFGVIGFVIVMAIWFLQFRELQYIKSRGVLSDVSIALQAGVAGLFVAGMSLDLMMTKFTWLAFSLIALVRSVSLYDTAYRRHVESHAPL